MSSASSSASPRRSSRRQAPPERYSDFEVLPEPKRRRVLNGKKKAAPEPEEELPQRQLPPLPTELWLQIISYIQDSRSVSVLSRVSKAFYNQMNPILYRDLVASAPCHGNIRGFIRSLQRYLTIAQRKQLRSEQHYVGQQERFMKKDNDEAIPYCTQDVKRLFIGWSNPGKNHLKVLRRYLEELLLQLKHLEAIIWLDAHIGFSDHIVKSIVENTNLKALAFTFSRDPKWDSVPGLSAVKNLTYFDMNVDQSGDRVHVARDIIFNSKGTLQTFIFDEVKWGHSSTHLVEALQRDGQTIQLPNLTTISLSVHRFEAEHARVFLEAVDMNNLEYFEFSAFQHDGTGESTCHALFRALMEKHAAGTLKLRLKTLRFRTSQQIDIPKEFLQLLTTFSTLQTFIYEDTMYGTHHDKSFTAGHFVSALKSHKNLRWLGLISNVHGTRGGSHTLTKPLLEDICKSFPELRHLSGAFDPDLRDETLAVLPTFPKLERFHSNPLYRSHWLNTGNTAANNKAVHVVVIEAFLNHLASNTPEGTLWEDHFALHTIVCGTMPYELAQSFPKTRNASMKGETVEVNDRSIQFRGVPPMKIYEGDWGPLMFLRCQDWRSRNYDAHKGDWLQGIRL